MERKVISTTEANEIIAGWSKAHRTVCFSVFYGDNAWVTQRIGKMFESHPGIWAHAAGHTTEALLTDNFEEVSLIEDSDTLAIGFRYPKGVTDAAVEIMLFASKSGQLDKKKAIPMISNLIH
jgi:hypothetical protein